MDNYYLAILDLPFISAKYICDHSGITHDRWQNVKRGLKFTDVEIKNLQSQISILKTQLEKASLLSTERNLMDAIISPFFFPKALIPKVGGNDTNYDRIFRAHKGAVLHPNEKALLLKCVNYVIKLL